MPEVRVTDEQGVQHVFPDGSTPEMISKAMNLKPSTNQTPAAEPNLADKALTPAGDLGTYAGATRDAILDVAGKFNSPGAWLARKMRPNDTSLPAAGEQGSDYVRRMAGQGPDPDHPMMRAAQVGIAGAAKDTADLGASFTSPLAVATMGGGALGKAGKAAQKLVGAGLAVKGAGDVITNAPAALQGDPNAAQKALYGGAMVAGGAPSVAEVVSPLAKFAGQKVAPKLANYAMGTPPKALQYGKNPGAAVLDEVPGAATMEGLKKNIGDVLDKKTQDLNKVLTSPQASAMKVNIKPAVDIIDAEIRKAANRNVVGLMDQLYELRQQITSRTMVGPQGFKRIPGGYSRSPYDVAELKRGVQDSVNWNSQDGFDEPLNNVKRQVQGALDKQVVGAVPESGPLNEAVSSLIEARKAAGAKANASAVGRGLVRTPEVIAGFTGAGAGGGPAGLAAFTAMKLARSTPGLIYGGKALRAAGKAAGNANLAKYAGKGRAIAAGAAGAKDNQD